MDNTVLVNPKRSGMVMGQTANLTAEAGDYQWTSPVDADAEPVPELEFDQTVDW